MVPVSKSKVWERSTFVPSQLTKVFQTFVKIIYVTSTSGFWCRPKSGSDERILTLALDGTQTIRYVKAKILEALEVSVK